MRWHFDVVNDLNVDKTKSGHLWTTYLPRLVNVVCERPLHHLQLRVCIYSEIETRLVLSVLKHERRIMFNVRQPIHKTQWNIFFRSANKWLESNFHNNLCVTKRLIIGFRAYTLSNKSWAKIYSGYDNSNEVRGRP